MKHKPLLSVVVMMCLAGSVARTAPADTAEPADKAKRPALKDAFADDFLVGVAVGTEQVMGQEPAAIALVEEQYNSITPENLLKWEEVHPEPDRYNFGPADRFVELGEKHGMKIIGHTLVWHNQTPKWVFEDEHGKPVDRETLLERMREHIHAVVGRYKGRIHGWDVVNEAIDDEGKNRPTPWQQIIGDDYIAKAFEYAHEADPDAELYYNDFSEWKPGRRAGYNRIVHDLRAKGLRIDGIGLQGHWGPDYPSVAEIEAMFADFGKLNVDLMITELDMNVLPRPEPTVTDAEVSRTHEKPKERDMDPYRDGLPPDVQQALADRYAEVFACFKRHSDKIGRVTLWGVHDGHSWLNYWPIEGRTAYPLLFDRQLQPKPEFDAVIEVAEED